jgi:hypothetical protein
VIYCRDGKDAPKEVYYEPILKDVDALIQKIPNVAVKTREALTNVYTALSQQIISYFNDFNPGFMNDLVQFGKR